MFRLGAPNRFVWTGILLLSWPQLWAGTSMEADPHELYASARNHLANGELKAAEAAIVKLRGLVAHGSAWDPDGAFANELLPPLLARLGRMQAAARELDTFCDHALDDLKSPDPTPKGSESSPTADWAASTIHRLHDQRDRILTDRLADPDERAALTRTPNYACTERVLETDLVRKLAESPAGEPPVIAAGDPRVDPILVRVRQLKQELMQIVTERDRLLRQMSKSRELEAQLLRALADITSDGALPAPRGTGSGPDQFSGPFAELLDRELAAARAQPLQTSEQFDAWQARLDRYRRYNAVLVQSALGKDLSGRIGELSRAIEDIRLDPKSHPGRSGPGWGTWMLLTLLSAAAALFAGLAIVRGRRLRSLGSVESASAGAYNDLKVDKNAA